MRIARNREIAVMMVAVEKATGDEVYPIVKFDIGNEPLPQNNTKDIMRIVKMMNDGTNPEYEYLDVFGISVDGKTEAWEEFEDAV